MMNQDGTGLTQLTDANGGEGSPCWSPDGGRVAVIQEAEGSLGYGSAGELWIVDIDSGDTERLIEGPVLYPDWSPDGSRIAYVATTDAGPQISVLDMVSGEVTDLGPGFFRDGIRPAVTRRPTEDLAFYGNHPIGVFGVQVRTLGNRYC